MEEIIITAIISAIGSGSLVWLFVIPYTRKQAQADAMKSVQEVYQGLIEDLVNDRKELKMANEELKAVNGDLKERVDQVDRRYNEIVRKCEEMDMAIKKNTRITDTMKPFLCGVEDCPHRKTITFETNNLK